MAQAPIVRAQARVTAPDTFYPPEPEWFLLLWSVSENTHISWTTWYILIKILLTNVYQHFLTTGMCNSLLW